MLQASCSRDKVPITTRLKGKTYQVDLRDPLLPLDCEAKTVEGIAGQTDQSDILTNCRCWSKKRRFMAADELK